MSGKSFDDLLTELQKNAEKIAAEKGVEPKAKEEKFEDISAKQSVESIAAEAGDDDLDTTPAPKPEAAKDVEGNMEDLKAAINGKPKTEISAAEFKAEVKAQQAPTAAELKAEINGNKEVPKETEVAIEKLEVAETPKAKRAPKTVAPATQSVSEAAVVKTVTPPQRIQGLRAVARVHKVYTHAGELVSESSQEELIDVPMFTEKAATVGMTLGSTVNMGDYNSLKADVFISVPTYLGEENDALGFCSRFCNTKIEAILGEIKISLGGKLAEIKALKDAKK